MRGRRVSVLVLGWLSLAGPVLAQDAAASHVMQATAVPIRLPQAVYPPIAQSALVQGQVLVSVSVLPDGTVASAELSGPGVALLNQAALDAAKRAQFDCRGCAGTPAPYSIVYAFTMDGVAGPSGEVEQPAPAEESPTSSRVTTVVETPPIACVLRARIAVRSATCLWLWHCGAR